MIGWASTKKWHIIKFNPLILSNKVFYAFLNQFSNQSWHMVNKTEYIK